MKNRFCILLTGTISPLENTINLVHKDVSSREQDYITSLKKWVELPYPIIFCENSNYASQAIRQIFEDKPESQLLQFQSYKLSKGEGEAEIFEYAFANSEILQNSEFVIKCTGRYFVRNTRSIVDQISKYSQLEDTEIWADLKVKLTYSDSRFFIFKNPFFKNHLKKYLSNINELEGAHFEHCLARGIHSCMAAGKKWDLLPEPIICEGVYGTTGTRYKNDFFRIQKRKLLFELKRRILSGY